MQCQDAADATNDVLDSLRAFERVIDNSDHKALSLVDFEVGRTIGRGRFARVRLAKLRQQDSIPLCLKILKKTEVLRLEQVTHVVNEKAVLASVRHPFIINMLQTFQDAACLYMALELVSGGELFTILREHKTFKLPMVRFYIAEATSAISYLHSMLVVYRDVKPENILVHATGNLKLSDFGFAKYLKDEKTYTVCGTSAYMAPEIIRQNVGYGLPVDWYGIGILCYELISGKPPYFSPDESVVFQQALIGHIRYPPGIDRIAKDFIARLALVNPSKRLGSAESPWGAVKDHAFFRDIDWKELEAGRIEPPWRPTVDTAADCSLFGAFAESTDGAIDSCKASFLVAGDDDPFKGWEERCDFSKEAAEYAAKLDRDLQAMLEEKRRGSNGSRRISGGSEAVSAFAKEAAASPCKPASKPKGAGKHACCALQ